MSNKFQAALEKAGVSVWRIVTTKTDSAELYFIKDKLDLPRYTSIQEVKVTVFRDFEENGMKFRGSTVSYMEDGMTEEEIEKKLKDAYYAASFVKNPYFDFPKPAKSDLIPSKADFKDMPITEVAEKAADALLSVKGSENAFINSAEIFVYRSTTSIQDSFGTDVSFVSDRLSGEMITQCVAPLDVEQYREFSYRSLDLESLKKLATDTIHDVELRANAQTTPKAGTYDVILTGTEISSLVQFYGMRSESSLIFPHYSTWSVGDNVQGEVKEGGEKLTMTLTAAAPFSEEGIPMVDRVLLEDGVLKTIHGGARFASYLGIEPTGGYHTVKLAGGTVSYEEMKKPGVLEAVSFSDFQTDFMSGNFGGEMRLALLHGENGATPLTGGSINANLMEKQCELVFSKEQYKDANYEGPLAVLIKGVSVAGI